MTRIHLIAVLGLLVAVPATAAAGLFFESRQPAPQPCFAASNGPYRLSTGAADYTVRIDNAAAEPALRLQIVDDPAIADFVLVDDGIDACAGASVRSVRIDNTAPEPDLVIAVSEEPARTKIYVKSAIFSAEAAAALFAVSAKTARRNVAARAVAR
jgi:hypothetical protein